MKTKFYILLLIITAGIYSCKKDKRDVLYPPKDYRDSVVGSYTGMKIVRSWDISHNYNQTDSAPCVVHVIKDNSDQNAINIEGAKVMYYENDSIIHGYGIGNSGWFTPTASQFGMYFWISSQAQASGISTNYRVTKD